MSKIKKSNIDYSLYLVTDRDIINENKKDIIQAVKEAILGGGGLFATNSYFILASNDNNRPTFFYNTYAGDGPTLIYHSINGKIYYIDKIMSVNRKGVEGSWGKRMGSDFIKTFDRLDVLCYPFRGHFGKKIG